MIKIQNLTKIFEPYLVVDDVSFSVKEGEVLGFLGPNGAGKSTTMKMLTGFLKPSEGKVSIFGYDVNNEPIAAKKLIGYLPEGAPTYDDMTVRNYLKFIGQIRGFSGDLLNDRINKVTKRLALQQVLDSTIETLSKGFKRRVGIAQAIIHDPKILILDEPTDGLDPNQKHQVRQLIHELSKDKIIIISTHILEEVHAVCSRAMIIAKGKILIDATPNELEKKSKYHGAVIMDNPSNDAIAILEKLPTVASVESDNEGRITVLPKSEVSGLFEQIKQLIEQHHWQVQSLYVDKGRLEDVFHQLTISDNPYCVSGGLS